MEESLQRLTTSQMEDKYKSHLEEGSDENDRKEDQDQLQAYS